MAASSGDYGVDDVILSPRGVFVVTAVLDEAAYSRVYRANWVNDLEQDVYRKRPVPPRRGESNSAEAIAERERRDPSRREDVVVKQLSLRPNESQADFEFRVTREAQITLHLIPSRLGRHAGEFCGQLGSCTVEQFTERAPAREPRSTLLPAPTRAFLVFPWMKRAKSLEDYVDDKLHAASPKPPPALRDMVMASVTDDVFAALGYLHRIGVVHNDVKPDNFISYVDENGERRVQLIDFGAACTTVEFTADERALLARDRRTLLPGEAERANRVRIQNPKLVCMAAFNVLPLLRDPMADSTEMFPNNRTYRRKVESGVNQLTGAPIFQRVTEIAFDNEEQRRTYYPIFERYAAAALIVYLYNYALWKLPDTARVPISAVLGEWPRDPIPEPLFRLIKGCTAMQNHRLSSEESVRLAEEALIAAHARFEREYEASATTATSEQSSTRSAKTPSPPRQ